MRRRRSKYALALWLALPIDLLASFCGMALLAFGVHGGGVFTIFGEVLCPAYMAFIRIIHYAFPTERFFGGLGLLWGHVPLCFLVQLPYYYVLVLMGLAIRAKRRPPVSAHCCEECGYNLTGNVSGICPECGTPVTRIQPDRASAQSPSDTHSDKRRKRTAIRLALAVIAAIMLTAGTFWLYHRPIPFDKNEWFNGSLRKQGRMVDDLIRSGLLLGLSEDQVEAILGTPKFQVLAYGVGNELLKIQLREGTVFVFSPPCRSSSVEPIQFDWNLWHSTPASERLAMALGFCDNRAGFVGTNRDETIETFGLPDVSEELWYASIRPGKSGSIMVRLIGDQVVQVNAY